MKDIRWCRWILALSALLCPFLIVLVLGLKSDTDNISNWLPQNTSDREEYDEFVKLFGHDDELLVSWSGCTVDDPRLDQLVSGLQAANRSERLFASIVSGKTVIDDLTKARYSLSESQLKRRLRGVFFDGQYSTTSIVLQLSEKGKANGAECLSLLRSEIESVDGLEIADAKIAGDAFTTVEIDKATRETLLYSLPAILFAVIFTYFCVGSFRLLMASFFAASSAALLAVAFVTFCGGRFNNMLVMMPVLVIVLTFSSTIHLSSYYKRAIWDGVKQPVWQMLNCGLRPCLLSVITTIISVVMLCVSSVPAVRCFGFYSAAGLSFSLFSILVLYPAILMVWKPSQADLRMPDEKRELDFYLRVSNSTMVTAANFVVLAFVVAVPLLFYGLGKIESRLQPERMFASDNPVVTNIDWLQKKFATVRSVDVVTTFDTPFAESDIVDQLYQLRKIQAKLAKLDAVKSTFSVVNVCKLPKRGSSAPAQMESDLFTDSLKNEAQPLVDRRLLANCTDQSIWRIRLGIDSNLSDDLTEIKSEIEEVASQVALELPDKPATSVTGIWLLYTTGRQHMFSDLVSSFVLAFLVITPLIVFVTRGLLSGLVAMLPNMFPALAFFGLLGWLGIRIDIGTLLTACVGLGIAVDDTLHFLHEFMRNPNRNRTAAAMQPVSHCFRPMGQTTLVCSIGLSVFAFSSFIPAQNFAVAICSLLALALICDMVLMPSIIIGPLGEWFAKNTSELDPQPETESEIQTETMAA